MSDLTENLLGRAWLREDGAEFGIERMLVDANWQSDVVYQFCREQGSSILLPSHGKGVGAAATPFSEYKRKPDDRIGKHWRIPNVSGKRAIRHILIDTNFWKSFCAARLLAAPGQRGALSFFGPKKSGMHQLLTEHLTSEFRVRTSGRGREVDETSHR